MNGLSYLGYVQLAAGLDAPGDTDRLTVGRTIAYFQDVLRYDRPQDEFWAAMDHSKRVPRLPRRYISTAVLYKTSATKLQTGAVRANPATTA